MVCGVDCFGFVFDEYVDYVVWCLYVYGLDFFGCVDVKVVVFNYGWVVYVDGCVVCGDDYVCII